MHDDCAAGRHNDVGYRTVSVVNRSSRFLLLAVACVACVLLCSACTSAGPQPSTSSTSASPTSTSPTTTASSAPATSSTIAPVQAGAPGSPDPSCTATPPATVGLSGLLSSTAGRSGSLVPVGAVTEPGGVTVVLGTVAAGGTYLVGIASSCRLDSSFGSGGVVAVIPPSSAPGASYIASSLTSDSSGDLVITGEDGSLGWTVARFTPGGQPAATFGRSGWVTVRDPGPALASNGYGSAVGATFGPGGELFVIGFDGQPHCCAGASVMAFSPTGQPVASFGSGGQVGPVPDGSFGDYIAFLPTGNLLAVGEYSSTGCGSFGLAEYEPQGGRPVPGFHGVLPALAGKARVATPLVVPSAGGGFFLVGQLALGCGEPADPTVGVLSYEADGSPDRAFGRGGLLELPGSLFGAILYPAGQLLIAAETSGSCVLRVVTGTGAPAASFGDGGSAPCGTWPKVGSIGLSDVTAAAGGSSSGDVELVGSSATGLAVARYLA
jgi:hypothetical protein